MDYFNYKQGNLFVEEIDVRQITEKVGTPVYIYSKATFLDHLNKMQKAYSELQTTVCYSVKACGNINILRFLAKASSGFDIVSGGELYRVLKAGADPSKIVYAGVGKTDKEIIEALDAKIGYFNIESQEELENLIRLTRQKGTTAKAALRVNPDIEYKTHHFLKTGKRETKFGVDIEKAQEIFEKYSANESVKLCAIHIHLGTGGKKIDPYVETVQKALPLIDKLRSSGYDIEAVDLGGGYGADYESATVPSADEYAKGIVPLLKGKNLKLIIEPGKSICANAGILVTQVLYRKQSGRKKFVIVDAAMNDLIRPCLYDAFHFIWPTNIDQKFVPTERALDIKFAETEQADIVGPICEGADFFAKDRFLPPVQRGDMLAIFTAGAYGFTMSSNYNSRCRCPEVLVEGKSFEVIRQRENYQNLTSLES
ncbi:MAG: diaminopimelate decarboxylase [Phycisphaerae bacterium]